jgi:peptidoglycan/xylan/chitin deacetylase (PgdA/CDA1 family)
MHHSGIDFGAHTLTHPNLTKLNLEMAKTEIFESKAIIEYVLNAPAKSFAYPYGLFDSRVQDIVKHHFVCACSDKLGLITKDTYPYAIERVDTCYFKSRWLFDIISSRLLPFYMFVRNVPREIRRAFKIRQY